MRRTTNEAKVYRKIWEEANGKIPEGKEIHHKNGDWADNRIENLECLDRWEHLEKHGKCEIGRYVDKEIDKSRTALMVRTISVCREYSNGLPTVGIKMKGGWLEKLGLKMGQRFIIQVISADMIILDRVK